MHNRLRDSPRLFHRNALGDGARAKARRFAFDRAIHRGETLALDADNVDGRIDRLRRHRHAGDHSAAADGDNQRIEIGLRRQHFQRDCALARDHFFIVVGMNPH